MNIADAIHYLMSIGPLRMKAHPEQLIIYAEGIGFRYQSGIVVSLSNIDFHEWEPHIEEKQ